MRYQPPQTLTFLDGNGASRFWCYPAKIGARPTFLDSILDVIDPWECCWTYLRSGNWSGIEHYPEDLVWSSIMRGIGIPKGRDFAVCFEKSERYLLQTAAFAQATCGDMDDLFIVPDHGRQIIYFDHHEVAHVECADKESIFSIVDRLAAKGFDLPKEPPDWTFKIPDWMKERQSS